MNNDRPSDTQLTQKIVAYLPNLSRMAHSRLDWADADDVVQQTVTYALGNLSQWGKGPFESWLKKILFSRIADVSRMANRQENVLNKISLHATTTSDSEVQDIDPDIEVLWNLWFDDVLPTILKDASPSRRVLIAAGLMFNWNNLAMSRFLQTPIESIHRKMQDLRDWFRVKLKPPPGESGYDGDFFTKQGIRTSLFFCLVFWVHTGWWFPEELDFPELHNLEFLNYLRETLREWIHDFKWVLEQYPNYKYPMFGVVQIVIGLLLPVLDEAATS